MYQRFQEEGRDLGFVVNDFESDILLEIEQIKNGGKGHYLSPSLYLPPLKAWHKVFGKDQIRVYFAENLNDSTRAKAVLQDIQNYLGLPIFDFEDVLKKRFNVAPKAKMNIEIQKKLSAFFKIPNQELAAYLGKVLPDTWNNSLT